MLAFYAHLQNHDQSIICILDAEKLVEHIESIKGMAGADFTVCEISAPIDYARINNLEQHQVKDILLKIKGNLYRIDFECGGRGFSTHWQSSNYLGHQVKMTKAKGKGIPVLSA